MWTLGVVVQKSNEAFRTISEVAAELDIPKHVLRFWEGKFTQLKPMKRGGGRRYYRPEDIELLKGIYHLLKGDGYTIKGVQKLIKNQGVGYVKACWQEDGAGGHLDQSPDIPDLASEAAQSAAQAKQRIGKKSGKEVPQQSVASDNGLSGPNLKVLKMAIKDLEQCQVMLGKALRAT